jgi:hypothetical protein
MDLSAWLRRYAARRPHVLIVASRNGAAVRLAVEAELARRGWPIATAPADADVLLVAGIPGPELATTIEAAWGTVPLPRAYATVDAPDVVEPKLSRASADLATGRPSAGPAPRATTSPPEPTEDGRGDEPRHPDQDPDDESHREHDQHGGHDEMEMPGGLPMADLGDDRDGLVLDQLPVALGPVLPDWPAGLVLEVALQGDVVQQARARLVDDPLGEPFWPPGTPAALDHGDLLGVARRTVARELDAVARFIGVAGWSAPAARARRLRDRLLAGEPLEPIRVSIEALVRQVRRSRTLRRMLRGLPHVPALFALRLDALEHAAAALHEPAAGTASPAAATSAMRPDHSPRHEQARLGLAEVERLLVGADLAAARLLIAAADPVTEGGAEDGAGDGHAMGFYGNRAARAGHGASGSGRYRDGGERATDPGRGPGTGHGRGHGRG